MDLSDCCWTRHISRFPVALHNEQLILACSKEKESLLADQLGFQGITIVTNTVIKYTEEND